MTCLHSVYPNLGMTGQKPILHAMLLFTTAMRGLLIPMDRLANFVCGGLMGIGKGA